MNISDFLMQVRGDIRLEEALFALVEIAANIKTGHLPVEVMRCGPLFRRGGTFQLFEGAGKAILEMDRRDCFGQIETIMDREAEGGKGEHWMRRDASEQLVALIGDARHVRFSFGMTAHPCLIYAMRMSERGEASTAEFCNVNADVAAFLRDLSVLLDLGDIISIETAWPWALHRTKAPDIEVMLPPFGAYLRDDEDVSDRILGSLGLEPGKRVRLSAEGVAIADALANAKGRAIISVCDGALYRMVGAEPVARRNLIESGRLQAVMAVPPGLAFSNTMIRTSLLVLSEQPTVHDVARFIDLGHSDIAQKGRRGRYEVLPDARWPQLLTSDQPEVRGFVRDVSVPAIAEENFVLTPERYLNTGPRERIEAFLEKSTVATLGDLVEMVRPVSLIEDEGGEYILLEAAPSDVTKRGFIDSPSRSITVDRAKYIKASNQQLKPGDIVIAIKGTVGAVGMVPDEVPRENEREIWTAGQSMMILRPKPRSGLGSLALFEYLSNPTVQEFIRSLAAGTAIQTIAMKDLTALRAPVPDAATVGEIEASFAERQAVFDQIAAMEERLKDIRARAWPHAQLQADG